ncbi:MAG: TonB C-terminal domain-containing protein [Myxococcota bacterium]|nr:TonB C-terminal domain-containing protein [Myxococcota bacterium]
MRTSFRSALGLTALLLFTPVAQAAGRANLQAYFQQTLTSADYQQKAFAKVAAKWKQPSRKVLPALGNKAVVQVVIGSDGKLLSAELTTKSGSAAWDKAALSAVKKAAPFPPLPKSFPAPSVEAHFHIGWEK